ncbi:hypothetical protein Tco_1238570 [Tanacetum coccineum]
MLAVVTPLSGMARVLVVYNPIPKDLFVLCTRIHAVKAKKGLKKALTEGKCKRLGLSEQTLQKAASQYGTALVYSKEYSSGFQREHGLPLRILDHLRHGCMVLRWLCLICRDMEDHLMMHRMFRSNRGCGYDKKPRSLMRTGPNGEVLDLKSMIHVKKTLKVRVYMGDRWRMDFSHVHFNKFSPTDFYTKEVLPTEEMNPVEGHEEESTVKGKDKIADLEHGEGSLDQIMVKHKSRLERENVVAANVDVPDNKTKNANCYTYFGPGTVDTIKCHLNVQDSNVNCCVNAIPNFAFGLLDNILVDHIHPDGVDYKHPQVLASQITAGQSGCDTQPDVPTLTCFYGSSIYKPMGDNGCFANVFLNKPERGEDYNILQALLSTDMLILFVATFCVLGTSLTAVDNLGQIGESLGYPNKDDKIVCVSFKYMELLWSELCWIRI